MTSDRVQHLRYDVFEIDEPALERVDPADLEQGLAVGGQGVGTQNGVVDLGLALGKDLRAVVGVVVAQGHGVDDAVEPAPLGALVFVGPGRRAPVDQIAAAKDQHVGIGRIILKIANQSGDAGHAGLPFGIKGHGMGVIIRKMKQGDGGTALGHNRRYGK